MPKRLAALTLALLLCGGAVTAIAADSVQPRTTSNPVLLAQNMAAPAARGRGLNRPASTDAQRTMRRGAFCQNAHARAAGRFAELEVRLNLTPAQTPAFTRWRDQRLATAKRVASDCEARPAPGRGGIAATPPNPVERLAQQQTRLERRLADIRAERPALEAFYGALNPEQRQTLARARDFGARERGGLRRSADMRRGGRMGFGGPDRDGNMMFRRGPMSMDRPMGRGPGASGDQPPPPPPSQFPQ